MPIPRSNIGQKSKYLEYESLEIKSEKCVRSFCKKMFEDEKSIKNC